MEVRERSGADARRAARRAHEAQERWRERRSAAAAQRQRRLREHGGGDACWAAGLRPDHEPAPPRPVGGCGDQGMGSITTRDGYAAVGPSSAQPMDDGPTRSRTRRAKVLRDLSVFTANSGSDTKAGRRASATRGPQRCRGRQTNNPGRHRHRVAAAVERSIEVDYSSDSFEYDDEFEE